MAEATVSITIHAAVEPPKVGTVDILPGLPSTLDLEEGSTFDFGPFFKSSIGLPLVFSWEGPALVSVTSAGILSAVKAGEGTGMLRVADGR